MCLDDNLCRCHIEEQELKEDIKRAKKLLKDNGYEIIRVKKKMTTDEADEYDE